MIPMRKAVAWFKPSMRHYWIYGVLLLAIFSLWVLVQQSVHLAQVIKNRAEVASGPAPTEIFRLKNTPITAAAMNQMVTQIRQVNPSLLFTVSPAGDLDIDAAMIESYPEWSYAVNSLYSVRPGWLWSATEICMGEGKCSKPLHVRVRAQHQEMIINEK